MCSYGSAAAQTTAAPDTTIVIQSEGANLEFNPSEIAVKQGKRVRIRYINNGTFPHNIVILKKEADIDIAGVAAFQAGSTGYIPEKEKGRMVAYSTLAEPGKTVEFTFVAPAPGEYPFVCLYPGHYNMMMGTFKSLR
jgi:uncharacterized cupredoxin-like copper-binding protein